MVRARYPSSQSVSAAATKMAVHAGVDHGDRQYQHTTSNGMAATRPRVRMDGWQRQDLGSIGWVAGWLAAPRSGQRRMGGRMVGRAQDLGSGRQHQDLRWRGGFGRRDGRDVRTESRGCERLNRWVRATGRAQLGWMDVRAAAGVDS
eukprot:352476-Chlamydomonas_euryale.AAC.8